MKKEKDVNYYRKLLNIDIITLIVVCSLAIVFGIITNGNEGIGLFIRSFVYLIGLIVLIINKKENKKFVGVLSIVLSSFMILMFIVNHSLFDVVYVILGIFYLIHSIKYLKKLNNENIQVIEEVSNGKYKYLKYISLALLLVSFVVFIIGMVFDKTTIGLSLIGIITLALEIAALILCILSHIKKEKGVLIYILMVLSILAILFNGMFAINDLKNDLRSKKYYNSEKFIIETAKGYEESIESNISSVEILKQVYNRNNEIISLDNLLKVSHEKYFTELLKENNYKCDGYVVLSWNPESDQKEYYRLINDEYAGSYTMEEFFSSIEAYISCAGKYNYQTEGFDKNKLEQSKVKVDINQYESQVKYLELLFNQNVESWYKQKLTNKVNNMIVTRNNFESETKGYFDSIFDDYRYKDYNCNGYVILNTNELTGAIEGKPYISCTGKYKYETEGYNPVNLNQ